MSGPEFYQTVMGHRFFEGRLPKLIEALERIAKAMKKQNEPIAEDIHQQLARFPLKYRGLVVDSEETLRQAIKIINRVKPCTLWIEELEKDGFPIMNALREFNLDTPVTEMELNVRTQNCLHKAGIETVRQLVEWTAHDLVKLRNMSRRSLHEINDELNGYGFYLKGSDPKEINP